MSLYKTIASYITILFFTLTFWSLSKAFIGNSLCSYSCSSCDSRMVVTLQVLA